MHAVTDVNRGILNDPDNTFDFIDQGKFFPGEVPGDPVDATAAVAKALLASALSAVWLTGDPTKHSPPMILTSDGMPQDGTGCESYSPDVWSYAGKGGLSKTDFRDNVMDGALTCIDDKPYWLMGARIDLEAEGCKLPITGLPAACVINTVRFDPLYNLDKIGQFNLTKEEVVGESLTTHPETKSSVCAR